MYQTHMFKPYIYILLHHHFKDGPIIPPYGYNIICLFSPVASNSGSHNTSVIKVFVEVSVT